VTSSRVIEVFADVGCPFTHVGLRRLVAYREQVGREDVRFLVRAWPLEVVNGEPFEPDFIAEEVDALRDSVAPDLFTGFRPSAYPATSIPPLALAHAAFRRDLATGEALSLHLRTLLFEEGVDVADADVLADVGRMFDVEAGEEDVAAVDADRREGVDRGVIGSPHFFTAASSYFCPALDIRRDDGGHLHISMDADGFQRFVEDCFA
jgi:predicted DsbA family dithiol-disulfide isomerase